MVQSIEKISIFEQKSTRNQEQISGDINFNLYLPPQTRNS